MYYLPTATPPGQKKVGGAHLPLLRHPGSRGARRLPAGPQCRGVLFRVTHVSRPRGRLTVREGGTAILTPVQQAVARPRSCPRWLVPFMVPLGRGRKVSGQLVSMRNQEVFHTVHTAPASSTPGRRDGRHGRTRPEGTAESIREDAPVLPATASDSTSSLHPTQLDLGHEHGAVATQDTE